MIRKQEIGFCYGCLKLLGGKQLCLGIYGTDGTQEMTEAAEIWWGGFGTGVFTLITVMALIGVIIGDQS